MKTKNDYREQLADSFIRAIEEDGLQWKKGWTGVEAPKSAITGTSYKGVNRFALTMAARENGYEDNRWATFKQIQDNGWKLEKGSKGVQIEFWVPLDPETNKPTTWEKINEIKRGNPDITVKGAPQYFYVFNGDRIQGIPERQTFRNQDIKIENIVPKISQNMGVEIINDGGNRAFYRPSEDKIHLPKPEQFHSSYDYYATAMHELAHASGAENRLARDLTGRFGTPAYAFEELVAEMSSAFMSEHLPYELPAEQLESHKAYLQSWMTAIKDNPDYLIQAIRKADICANYLEEMGEIQQELQKELQQDKTVNNEINYDDFVESHVQMLHNKEVDKPTLVISAYAGPGAGKTTACLQVTEELKKAGYVAEYVQEYAKELVWDENWEMLDGTEEHQFEILKEQLHRLDRLYGKVDFIVTDASVLVNGIYNKELTPAYDKMISQLYEHYNTTEFFVERDASKFEQEGRIQNLEESIAKDAQMKEFLAKNDISYTTYNHENISDITRDAIRQYEGINSGEKNMTMEQRYTEALKIAGYEIIPTPEESPATITIRNIETGHEIGSDGWGGIIEELENIEDKSIYDKIEHLLHPQTDVDVYYYTQNLGGTGLGKDAEYVKHPDFESAFDAFHEADLTDGKTIGIHIEGGYYDLAYYDSVINDFVIDNDLSQSNYWEDFKEYVSADISYEDYNIIQENIRNINTSLGKERAYAHVLEGVKEVIYNAHAEILSQESLKGSWNGRIANDSRPQDYVMLELIGDEKSKEITALLTTVHANEVTDVKYLDIKIQDGNLEQGVQQAFEQIGTYFTKDNDFVRKAAYSLDTDFGKPFTLYAPFMDKGFEEHYKMLADRGYQPFPDYDNYYRQQSAPVISETITPEVISEKKTELIQKVCYYDLQKMELQKGIENYNQNIEDTFRSIAAEDISQNGAISANTKQLMELYGVQDKQPFLDNVIQIDSAKGDLHIYQDKSDYKKNYLGKKVEHNGVKMIQKMSESMDLKSAREQLKANIQQEAEKDLSRNVKQVKSWDRGR